MKKKVWPQRRMQVDAYAAGAPGGGPVLQAATPSVRVGCAQPAAPVWGSRAPEAGS